MYYVIEHDVRPDGVVNTSETGRTTFAAALSHYYERKSKLVMNTDFTSAHIMLVDETLVNYEFDHIKTLYVPKPEVEEPKDEPKPEPTPEPETEAEPEAEEEDGTTAEDE